MRKFRVYDTFEDTEIHDYDVIVELTDEGEEFSLYRSNGGNWAEENAGEKIISLLDTGNGIVFPGRDAEQMDYAEFAELFVLLSVMNKTNYSLPIYKGRIEEVLESVNFNI